jgi:hypothetical protein
MNLFAQVKRMFYGTRNVAEKIRKDRRIYLISKSYFQKKIDQYRKNGHPDIFEELSREELEKLAFTITTHYLQTAYCYDDGMFTRNMRFCRFSEEIILRVIEKIAKENPWFRQEMGQEMDFIKSAPSPLNAAA